MIDQFYGPLPNTTYAFHTDGTHKWYGRAAKRSETTDPRWQIMKMEYTGDNWITKWPDGDDAPKFKWTEVTSLTYKLLGT